MGKTVLLYGGGMDSWIMAQILKPDVKLYVDLGTKYAQEEIAKLPPDVIVEKLDLGRFERADAVLPLRNLYLVMMASNYGDTIYLGSTTGDIVLDNSETFAEMASAMLSFLHESQAWHPEPNSYKVLQPFKGYTKKELLGLYLKQGGSIDKAAEESFTCYYPLDGKECWACSSCMRKFVAFTMNGYTFDTSASERMLEYMDSTVLERIKQGTKRNYYGWSEQEETDTLKTYQILVNRLY